MGFGVICKGCAFEGWMGIGEISSGESISLGCPKCKKIINVVIKKDLPYNEIVRSGMCPFCESELIDYGAEIRRKEPLTCPKCGRKRLQKL